MTMSSRSNFDIAKQWFDTLWAEADIAAIKDLSQSDIYIEGPITALGGTRNDYGDMVMALNGLLSNITFEYENPVEAGDLVAAKILVFAQSVATNDDVRFAGHFIARIKDGKVAELTATMDYMKMFEHLGQLPEESLAICLTGEKLIWDN